MDQAEYQLEYAEDKERYDEILRRIAEEKAHREALALTRAAPLGRSANPIRALAAIRPLAAGPSSVLPAPARKNHFASSTTRTTTRTGSSSTIPPSIAPAS
jgi:hypothetical protein